MIAYFVFSIYVFFVRSRNYHLVVCARKIELNNAIAWAGEMRKALDWFTTFGTFSNPQTKCRQNPNTIRTSDNEIRSEKKRNQANLETPSISKKKQAKTRKQLTWGGRLAPQTLPRAFAALDWQISIFKKILFAQLSSLRKSCSWSF